MPLIDYPLETLRSYRPEPNAPTDLTEFWQESLDESKRTPLNSSFETIEYPVTGLEVQRVSYDGWRGARMSGWFLARKGARSQATLVFYHGYGGSKGQVYDYLAWALQGYTVLAVDVRGQSGDSSDPGNYPGGHVSGWMTKGILSKDAYYYRGAYVESVRALDLAVSRPEVDPDRIGVLGVSQGGGLTLAVAALDSRPKLAMPEVPFLCHYRRAVEVSNVNPYLELALYCHRHPDRESQVFDTLRYFDNLSIASRITCPVLMTVGLQDLVCPPSTIFAVYNHLSSTEKEIRVYPYGAHEAFPTHHEHKVAWARRILKPD